MDLTLNDEETEALFQQDPDKKAGGGFQGLIVGLQEACDRSTGAISVTDDQRRRIKQYADYRSGGGWENQLKAAFSRHLGPVRLWALTYVLSARPGN